MGADVEPDRSHYTMDQKPRNLRRTLARLTKRHRVEELVCELDLCLEVLIAPLALALEHVTVRFIEFDSIAFEILPLACSVGSEEFRYITLQLGVPGEEDLSARREWDFRVHAATSRSPLDHTGPLGPTVRRFGLGTMLPAAA